MKLIKIVLLALFCVGWPLAIQSQTIIELGKSTNKRVRSKSYHDYDRKIEHLAPTKNDSAKYNEQISLAYNLFAIDSLAEASALLHDCIEMRPKARVNYVLWHTLGSIAVAEGEMKEAADCFTKVLQLMPNEYGTRLERAEVMLQIGNTQAAIADCEIALPHAQTDSLRARIEFVRGSAELMEHKYALAIAHLKRAVNLNEKMRNARLLVAMATAADNRPKEALTLIEEYLREYPKDEEALLFRMQLREELR